MKYKIINTFEHQAIWWSSVLGAIFAIPYLGPIVVVPVIIFHLNYISDEDHELSLIVVVALLGTAMDTFYNIFGIVEYRGTYQFAEWLAPMWITSMWVSFSTTINHSLKKVNSNKLIGVLLGAIFGPIAYLAGERYGAIELIRPKSIALIILSISWGGIIPLLFVISNELKRRFQNEG